MVRGGGGAASSLSSTNSRRRKHSLMNGGGTRDLRRPLILYPDKDEEVTSVRLSKFLLTRIMVWILTIFVGITVVFFLQRMMPSDPINNMIGKITSMGTSLSPEEIESMRTALMRQYGLDGTLLEQYGQTLKNLLRFDFGLSIANYPTPVSVMIGRALPYTVALLLTTTVLSWIIGNAIGLLAGFKKEKWYSKTLETISMCIYPTPYFMLALVIMILMAYVKRWYPLIPSFRPFEFTFEWFSDAIHNSFMPALSLMLVGTGWWIISMKSRRQCCGGRICQLWSTEGSAGTYDRLSLRVPQFDPDAGDGAGAAHRQCVQWFSHVRNHIQLSGHRAAGEYCDQQFGLQSAHGRDFHFDLCGRYVDAVGRPAVSADRSAHPVSLSRKERSP